MTQDVIETLERLTADTVELTESEQLEELVRAGKRALRELRQCQAQVPLLRRTVRRAAEQFRHYQREHIAKADAAPSCEARLKTVGKAAVNQHLAEACEAALGDGA